MSQLYCDHTPSAGENIIIEGDDFHHLLHVRRHAAGDTICLRTDDGALVVTEIIEISTHSLILTVRSIEKTESLAYSLILAMPILKGKKNDLIIEKGVEAGVTRFIPVLFDRSIPDSSHAEKKQQRWQKIAHEAYKQSNALFRAVVDQPIVSHSLFTDHQGCSTALLCDVHEKEILKPHMISRSVICAIGPEGGFSPEELKGANAGEWTSVSVMTNQLRAESAAIILPAIIRHFMFI